MNRFHNFYKSFLTISQNTIKGHFLFFYFGTTQKYFCCAVQRYQKVGFILLSISICNLHFSELYLFSYEFLKLAVFDFGLYFWVHFVALLRVPGPAAPRPLTAGPLGHDGEPAAGQSPTARFNAFTARALAANGDGEHGHRRVQLACADWKTRSRGTTRNDPKTAALRLEVAGKLRGR